MNDILNISHSLLGSRWRHQGRGWDFLFNERYLALAASDFEAWRALLHEQYEAHLSVGYENGFDCAGFVLVVLLLSGWTPSDLEVLRWTDYARVAADEHMMAFGRDLGQETTLDKAQPGDVLVVRFEGDNFAQHVGFITRRRADGVLYFQHASNEEGRIIEHRLAFEWKERVSGVFRFHAPHDGVTHE